MRSNDPADRKAWSDAPFHVRAPVAGHADVRVVLVDPGLRYLPDRLLARASRSAGRKYLRDGSIGASIARGRAASRETHEARPEVVVALAAICEVASLGVAEPAHHVDDETLRVIKDYTTGLSLASRVQSDWIVRRALRRAGACFFSAWASRSAAVDYCLDPRKVHVVEFGACTVPAEPPAAVRRDDGERRILFIAGSSVGDSHAERVSEWVRKRGPRALRVLDELIVARGGRAGLSMVGDVPVELAARADVRACGYLDPNTETGRAALSRAYLGADVLIDPPPATCAGLVPLDAAARGLPWWPPTPGDLGDGRERGNRHSVAA